MPDEKKDLIYDKLLDGSFEKIEKQDSGYRVEKHYNSMRVYADLNKDGKILDVGAKASALSWVLGAVTFPLGSVAVILYMNTRKNERMDKMRTMVLACLK